MCCDGIFQDRLIHRLDQEFSLCGIVRHRGGIEKRSFIKRISAHRNLSGLTRHALTRMKLRSYESDARPVIDRLFHHHGHYPHNRPDLDRIECTDVNHPEVVRFIQARKPALICVNGTNLLRQPVLDLIDHIEFGIINLHTGLSPYSRGGNCNLYMLHEQKPEYVGITVHHIDRGIDSGDIIISCRPELKADDNYETIEAKCFHIGIEAMVHASRQLFSGTATRVKQWQKGKLFLNRTGYYYQPAHRLEVNRLIDSGLLADYLLDKARTDDRVRTVGDFDYHHD